MKLSKSLAVFLILLFSLFEVVAQESSNNTYVITQSNDTIFGKVYQQKPESVSFKPATASTFTTYTAEEIKGYKSKNGKFFIARELAFSEKETKTVFVEALVLGKASLFKLNEGFLLSKNDTTQIQIKKLKEEKIVNGRRLIQTSYSNAGAATYLLSDCGELPAMNKTSRITERNLTRSVVAYNKCTSGNYTEFNKEKAWTKFSSKLGIGMGISGIKFSTATTGFPFLTEANFTKSVSPTFLAAFIISSPRINEHLALRAGLLYTNNIYSTSYRQEHAQLPERYEVNVKMKSVVIPLSLQYVVTDQPVRTYFNLGPSLHWNLNPTINYKRESERDNTTYKSQAPPLSMEKYHYGFWAGLGAETRITNKLQGFVEIKGEITKNVMNAQMASSSKLLNANLSILSFFVGINF